MYVVDLSSSLVSFHHIKDNLANFLRGFRQKVVTSVCADWANFLSSISHTPTISISMPRASAFVCGPLWHDDDEDRASWGWDFVKRGSIVLHSRANFLQEVLPIVAHSIFF